MPRSKHSCITNTSWCSGRYTADNTYINCANDYRERVFAQKNLVLLFRAFRARQGSPQALEKFRGCSQASEPGPPRAGMSGAGETKAAVLPSFLALPPTPSLPPSLPFFFCLPAQATFGPPQALKIWGGERSREPDPPKWKCDGSGRRRQRAANAARMRLENFGGMRAQGARSA